MSAKVPLRFGRYEIIGRLGIGGMGELYLARQQGPEGLRRSVALKVMLPDIAHRFPGADRMFLEEMHILMGINHPNVVQLIDCGEERGVLYMVMEYVQGITLHELWSRIDSLGRTFPPDLAASLIGQACRGLHAAHELCDDQGRPRHLVHRDVSPQNIMCTARGAVKVIDFGIAWAAGRLMEATQAAMLKGKPSYMAPEHLRGQPLTRSSDIFAVGVVLHEIVAGRHLFRRDDVPTTIAAVIEGKVPALRSLRQDVPPRLDHLVARALSMDPSVRPSSAAAFADELDMVVREAGSRFASMESIASYLLSIGVQLVPKPPGPIAIAPSFTEIPDDEPPNNPPDSDLPTLSEVAVPLDGTIVQHLIGQRMVVLQSMTLDSRSERPPVPLQLGPDLLPVPLWLSVPTLGSLTVEVEPMLTADRKRMGIYANIEDAPEKRRTSVTMQVGAPGLCFFVGHRRVRLQPLRCDSARGDGRKPAKVSLSGTSLTLVAREPDAQLVVLHTTDEDDDTVHAACVSVL